MTAGPRKRPRPTPAVRAYREPENAPTGQPGPFLSQSFTVHGDPIPWQRVQSKNGQRFTAPRTRAYQTTVKLAARRGGVLKLAGDLSIRLAFFRATRRACDWDNLAKTIADSLNGIAWDDDSQIVEAHVVKGHDPSNPRTEVVISTLSNPTPVPWDDL